MKLIAKAIKIMTTEELTDRLLDERNDNLIRMTEIMVQDLPDCTYGQFIREMTQD